MTPTSPRKLRDGDLYRYCEAEETMATKTETVVAMTKTERWYAIVEELRASSPRLCSYGFQRLRLRPSASC
jgi:hypothetical protein